MGRELISTARPALRTQTIAMAASEIYAAWWLLLSAMDLAPDERRRFLERECTDDSELKAKLEALLASEESAYITGADIQADGGLTQAF